MTNPNGDRPKLMAMRLTYACLALSTICIPSRLSAQFTGDNLVVVIENPATGSRLTFNRSDLAVGVRPFVGTDSTPLDSILLARNIYPDAEAYAAVYELNPQLDSTLVPPNTEILIPSLGVASFSTEDAAAGYRFFITRHVDLKSSIVRTAETISSLVAEFSASDSSRFPNAAAREAAITNTRQVHALGVAVSAAIGRRTKPLEFELLDQVDGQLNALHGILRSILGASASVPDTTLERLETLATNAVTRAAFFAESHAGPNDPSRYPTVDVVITVIDTSGNEVTRFPVFYISPGLVDLRSPLEAGSAPVDLPLDVANWFIWAALTKEGPPSTQVFLWDHTQMPQRVELRVQKQ